MKKKEKLSNEEILERIQKSIDEDMRIERELYEEEDFNFSSIPDIDKIACKDCKYRLKEEDGAINSMCEKYEWMKPDTVLWDNKPCKYYKKG